MKKQILLSLFLCLCSGTLVLAQDNQNLNNYENEYSRAVKIGNRDSLAASCCHLSEYYSYRNADSTKKYCMEGLKYVNKNEREPYLELLNNLGYYYSSIGDTKKSVNILQETWTESKRLNADNVMKGDILSSIGVGYRRMNMTDSALYYYNEALQFYRKDEKQSGDNVAFLLSNIAVLYANTSRLDEAEKYIRQAVKSVHDSCDMDTRLYVSNTAGAIFTLQKKYDEAERIMLTSLECSRKEQKPRFILQCMSPLLSLYDCTNNSRALDKLAKEAKLQIEKLPSNSHEVLGIQETLATIYYKEKRYEESAALYMKQLKAYESNSQTPLENIYLGLARNYSKMDKPTVSAEYYEKACAALDSIHQSDIEQQLSEFSVKFETQQKELEIMRLEEERLAQKNLTMKWAMFSGLSVCLLLLWLAYETFRRKQEKHRVELIMAKRFIDGLEKERTRLAKELHDGICNDLLAIGMMLNLKEKDTETLRAISQSLESVRQDVRAVSHELTPPKFQDVSLDEILENQLDTVLATKCIDFSFSKQGNDKLWKNLPTHIAYEVYRIIQELSSNIILHSEATEVDLVMKITNCELEFILKKKW